MEFCKNDQTLVEITGMTADGNGVGRISGMAVFVPGTAVGDTAEIRIIKVCKNYLVGRLISLKESSDDRIESDCSVSNICGGCVFRHISYESERRIKRERLHDCLKHIAKNDLVPEEIIYSEMTERYRNKAMYPIGTDREGRVQIGFYAKKSHRIVSCGDCLLQPEEFSDIVGFVAEFIEENGLSVYDEQTGRGLFRHLYIRKAFSTGEIMVCPVINGNGFDGERDFIEGLIHRFPEIKSVVININRNKTNVVLGKKNRVIFGRERIEDTLLDTKFSLSPHSFYQVNHAGAQKLFEKAAELADPNKNDVLLDLYCGIGAIGLCIARKKPPKKLIGVEIVPEAIEDAKRNAKLNGIENTEFICSDAPKAAEILGERGELPDIVVVDPPRKGCGIELCKTLTERLRPRKIVYVSCDPATFARDSVWICEGGYKLASATPVDMFPRTAHVETVGLFEIDG